MSALALKLNEVRFPLRFGETLVGRSPYCSIVVDDPTISRQHASFQLTHAGLTVQDLGSRNGTKVNGQPICGSRVLLPGDRVQVGNQRFELLADGSGGALDSGIHPRITLGPCETPPAQLSLPA